MFWLRFWLVVLRSTARESSRISLLLVLLTPVSGGKKLIGFAAPALLAVLVQVEKQSCSSF